MAITQAQAKSLMSQANAIQSGINKLKAKESGSSSGGLKAGGTTANQQIQRELNAKGANLATDGIIGPLTKAAMAKFGQQSNQTMAVSDLQNKTPEMPQMKYPTNLYDVGINEAQRVNGSYYNPDGTPKTNLMDVYTQNQGDNLQQQISQMLDIENDRPSQAQLYRESQKETGILEKQKRANELSGQLNQIVAQGQANQLSVVGQGRGIPEAIIGGQQAQIGRETAIQALPVSAQLSAAQGDLEMAEKNLNTLFQIKSADAKAKYDFNVKVIDMVSQFATKAEDMKLQEVKQQEERKYQETQQLNKEAQQYAMMAFQNNQSSLGASISSLDYKSPTFKQDLAKLQSKLRDPVAELDRQLKNAQINQINAENAKATAIAKGEALTGKEKFIEGTFAARMEQANDFGVGFEEGTILKDGDYPSAKDGAKFRAKGKLPSELQDEKYKQYIQSQENFISAILRKESGAAISDEEYVREARKYYPQPGDGRDLIEQKRRTREISINGMKLASDGGYRVVKNSLDDVIKYAENGDIVIDDGGRQSNEDFFGKPASSGFLFYKGDK